MIESFISAGNNANISKFVSPQELDCRKNYAVVCQTDKKDYPWDYLNEFKVNYIGLSATGTVVITTSATPSAYVSIPLFSPF